MKCRHCQQSEVGTSREAKLYDLCESCLRAANRAYDNHFDPMGAYRNTWYTDGSAEAEAAARRTK